MEEYLLAFALKKETLKGLRVLDCPSGPGSFVAQANEAGCHAVGVDMLYDQSAASLEAKGHADIEACLKQLETGLKEVNTKSHEFPSLDFDEYAKLKRSALSQFLRDYQGHRNRYVHGRLPNLPLANRSFDLVLSGHLLFVYSPLGQDGMLDHDGERLDLQWHHQAVRELTRVSRREIRIYPTHALNTPVAARHRYIEPIVAGLTADGWQVTFEPSQYRQWSVGQNDCLVARRLV